MRITLDRSLFNPQSTAEALALVTLLTVAVGDIQRHAILTDPVYVPGGENEETDTWLSQRSTLEAYSFRNLLTSGNVIAAGTFSAPLSGPKILPALSASQPRMWFLPGALEVRVKRQAGSDWGGRVLTLDDAADLLREPTHLVLENARTEPAFIGYLANPANRATLERIRNQPGRIEIHGGGGGEAKRWIEALTTEPRQSVQWRRMLRAWVLFDQDSGNLNAWEPSTSALSLMQACEEVASEFGDGLSWICLPRREIESYVPDSGLLIESNTNQKGFVQQVITWRAHSNPHYQSSVWALDLKKGLHGDLLPSLVEVTRNGIKNGTIPIAAHMLKAPFSALTPGEVNTLERGLGEKLAVAFRTIPGPAWTADLPAEYDRGPSGQVPRHSFVQSLFDRI